MRWARQVIRVNRDIGPLIEYRHQQDPLACFANVTSPGERFAASMCNPPFHSSETEAIEGTTRKRHNLALTHAAPRNFGGREGELWCPGGEVGFIERMIDESAQRPNLCVWFTSLVSKSEHVTGLKRSLKRADAALVKTIDMAQGQKKSCILAWTFYRP